MRGGNRCLARSLAVSAAIHALALVALVLLGLHEPNSAPLLVRYAPPHELTATRLPSPATPDLQAGEIEWIPAPEAGEPVTPLVEPASASSLTITGPLRELMPSPGVRTRAMDPPMAEVSDLMPAALEAIARRRAVLEGYARFPLPDIDTRDLESQRRRRAEQIVRQAFEAMGGIDSLLAIREMEARVWLEALDNEIASDDPMALPLAVSLDAYPYPIGRWRSEGLRALRRELVRPVVNLSDSVIGPEAFRSPAWSAAAYMAFFETKWRPPPSRSRPRTAPVTADSARWHIVDFFLGDGVVIRYSGRVLFDDHVAEAVLVDDRRLGPQHEAFFDPESHLLVGLDEDLRPTGCAECGQFRGARRARWSTTFERYERVGSVLLPTQWRRRSTQPLSGVGMLGTGNYEIWPPYSIRVYLSLGINGARPDRTRPRFRPPELAGALGR